MGREVVFVVDREDESDELDDFFFLCVAPTAPPTAAPITVRAISVRTMKNRFRRSPHTVFQRFPPCVKFNGTFSSAGGLGVYTSIPLCNIGEGLEEQVRDRLGERVQDQQEGSRPAYSNRPWNLFRGVHLRGLVFDRKER
jgi:hypothetical protein